MTAAYFIGDSFCTSDFVNAMAGHLGWTPTTDSIGGTGYDAPPASGTTFVDRLAAIIASGPDVVVVEGGGNDSGADATVIAAAQTFWSGLRAGLPAAVFYYATSHRPPTAAKLSGIKVAANATGAVFADWVPWLTGTGNVAAPTGDGNRDIYMGSDDIHPTVEGSVYLGTRWALDLSTPGVGSIAGIRTEGGLSISLGTAP